MSRIPRGYVWLLKNGEKVEEVDTLLLIRNFWGKGEEIRLNFLGGLFYLLEQRSENGRS